MLRPDLRPRTNHSSGSSDSNDDEHGGALKSDSIQRHDDEYSYHLHCPKFTRSEINETCKDLVDANVAEKNKAPTDKDSYPH